MSINGVYIDTHAERERALYLTAKYTKGMVEFLKKWSKKKIEILIFQVRILDVLVLLVRRYSS